MIRIKPKIYAEALYKICQKTDNLDLSLKNFVRLLASHNQLSKIGEIIKFFTKFYNQAEETVDVAVESALAMDEAGQKEIIGLVKKLAKAKKINLNIKTSPELLGGYILNFADWQIDASIKSKLQQIKNINK